MGLTRLLARIWAYIIIGTKSFRSLSTINGFSTNIFRARGRAAPALVRYIIIGQTQPGPGKMIIHLAQLIIDKITIGQTQPGPGKRIVGQT